MGFDNEVKLKSGRISNSERALILERLGEIAQQKYDEFIVQGGESKGYNLRSLRGSLQYAIDVNSFDNNYWLQGKDKETTEIAYYFEYGTGLFNQKRAGKFPIAETFHVVGGRYIRPKTKKYMAFKAKDGKFVQTDRVKGVYPMFAMMKAMKYIEFNRRKLQRQIRVKLGTSDKDD